MYKLNQVFAIISFEKGCIKLLILDSEEKEPIFLFFDKIKLEYSYDFSNIINLDKVNEAICTLISKASSFIGLHIVRYIVNIPFLNVEITNYESPKFNLLDGYCNEDVKYSLMEKTSLLNAKSNMAVFSTNITKWIVDGQLFERYPLDRPGKNISFLCSTFWCDQLIYENIRNLLQKNHIDVISFTCNACLAEDNEITAYIDISDNDIVIYKNYKEQKINLGLNWIFEQIKNDMNASINLNVDGTIDSLCNTYNIKFPVPILSIYTSKYMEIQELTQKQLLCAVNKYAAQLVETIEKEVSDFNNIIINGSDNFYRLLESNVKFLFTKPHDFVNIDSKMISYHNIGSIMLAYNHVYAKLKTYSKDLIYSINPYLNDNYSTNQMINNTLLKFGVISTNWAAKLG